MTAELIGSFFITISSPHSVRRKRPLISRTVVVR
jgi:hypothetical protein